MKWLSSLVTVVVLLLCSAIDVAAATVGGAPQHSTSHTFGYWLVGAGALGATLAANNPTFLDLRDRMGPDDKIARIIEILNEDNEILDDMVVVECNKLTSHETTVRTGIPAPTWRKLYGFVQPTKSTVVKIEDSCGMLENYAQVDKALADLNNNTAAFRLSENRPILEGFNQEISDALFYANEDTEPEAFTGFGPRFNAPSAENGINIIDAAGAGGDNCSIWLIVWGEDKVHALYPKGSTAGFQMNVLGEVTIGDETNGYFQGYRTHYRWDVGLCVRDWRYVVRIANIDNDALVKNYATGADLVDLMTIALEQVKSLNGGRPAFYMNRKCRAYLRRQQVAKASSTLTIEQLAGKRVLMFDEVPCRRVDALGIAEAHVT